MLRELRSLGWVNVPVNLLASCMLRELRGLGGWVDVNVPVNLLTSRLLRELRGCLGYIYISIHNNTQWKSHLDTYIIFVYKHVHTYTFIFTITYICTYLLVYIYALSQTIGQSLQRSLIMAQEQKCTRRNEQKAPKNTSCPRAARPVSLPEGSRG